MSEQDTAQQTRQQAAQPIEVPPVHMQEPQMGSTQWMDNLDDQPPGMGMGRPVPPPSSPPPPPRKWWFARGAKPARAVSEAVEPPGHVKSNLPLRPIMYLSLCGIVVLGYLQYDPRLDKAQDLLGTTLPSVEPTGPTDPDLIMPAIDPRLGGPDALSLGVPALPVQVLEDASAEVVEPLAQPGTLVAASDRAAMVSQAEPAQVQQPTVQPTAQPIAQFSVDPALDERMRRMEQLMLEMSQQLAHMKTQQAAAGVTAPVATAPATPRPAVRPAPTPSVAPAATVPVAPQRTLVQAESAKAAPARPAQPHRVARVQPVAKPAAQGDEPAKPVSTGPQLIAVDMWNGEPSVVVTSGQPGDKRMRVLRPGDVVNGLALRSADPVSRTATFVAPGSQGLTLSMASGG
ncbi:hypothetical protein [Alicycliphilus denitrificans]|uniref:hypothetical protein n=1 Tax=Alicycliphilus denitrificans TaxID=179636 RepID=UPI00384ECA5B